MSRAISLAIAVLCAGVPAHAAFVDHTDVFEPVFATSLAPRGPGVAFVDFDDDGDEDVLVSHGADGLRLYENLGPDDFEFREATAEAGLPEVFGFAFGLAHADFDRDGDSDLVVADREVGIRFFENRGGVFEEMTDLAGTRGRFQPTSLSAGDLDGDGWTDVWVGCGTFWYDDHFNHCARSLVLHNRGDWVFEEVAEAWGVVDEGCALAVMVSDYDRDGDADLLSANDFGQFGVPHRLFRNDGLAPDGSARFSDVTEESGFGKRLYGMGIATADVDGNGRPDYFLTNIGRAVLLLGQPDGRFLDATDAYGVESRLAYTGYRATWGAAFMDLEQDGLWDLVVASGWLPTGMESLADRIQPSLLWRNLSDEGPAIDEAAELGIAPDDPSHGLAIADFDDDGDDDVLTAALGGLVHLYRNDGESGPVARVSLRGTVSNPDALGALLVLRCDGTARVRELQAGGSHASAHSPVQRIPLEGCPDGALLDVHWPSGLVETVPVDGDGAVVERTEPEWIAAEPAFLPADGASTSTVRVLPLEPDGSPVGPGCEVLVSSTAGAVGAVVDVGDGSYETTLTAPAAPGNAALTVSIDGEPVRAHPRVRFFDADRTLVRASSRHYEPGEETVVTVLPAAADGTRDGPGRVVVLDVAGGTVVGAVRDLGDGRYEATVLGDGGTSLGVVARVDGVPRGPRLEIPEMPAIDPVGSFVRITPAAVATAELEVGGDEPPTVTVEISPRNGVGTPVEDSLLHLYEIRGRSGRLVPLEVHRGPGLADAWIATLRAADVAREGPLEIDVDGIVLAARPELLVYDEPEEVVAAVDPAASAIGVYHDVLHADGEDYSWVQLRLSAGPGAPLPWVDGLSVESEALEAVEGLVDRRGTQYSVRMRTNPIEPGTFPVEVLFEGTPVGVTGKVTLRDPVVHDLAAIGVSTCLEQTRIPADGTSGGRVLIRPHDDRGFLVGSNVPVRLVVGGVEATLDYAMPGTYVARISPRREVGNVLVETTLPGKPRESRLEVQFYDPEKGPEGPEPDPCTELAEIEPPEDAGPDAATPEEAGPEPDSGGEDDSGVVDAGHRSVGARGGGCSCRASAHGGGGEEAGLLGLLVLLCLAHFRARPRARPRTRIRIRPPNPDGRFPTTEVHGSRARTRARLSFSCLVLVTASLVLPSLSRAEFADHPSDFEPAFFASQDSMGAGVAFLDFDVDGDQDLVVSHGGSGIRLYENGGPEDFVFTEVSAEVGLAWDRGFAFGIGAADLDRDGDPDLVVADRDEGVRLFENRGGVFVEITTLAMPRSDWYVASLAFGDVDADGWIDVWVAGYTVWYDEFFHHCAPNQLFVARGDGTFDEVAKAWGVDDRGCTLPVMVSDFDRDGDADLLSPNDFGQFTIPHRLYRNDGLTADGAVRFVDVAQETGFDSRLYAMGVATADVDGNGWPDYFTTSIGRKVLLLGGPDGSFLDATEAYGVASPFAFEHWRACWGAAFLDVEQNGMWDLALASGYLAAAAEIQTGMLQPSQLFSDLGSDGPAHDEAGALGVAPDDASRGLAVGDFDGDGDEDIFTAALGGQVHLFRNDGEAGPSLSVDLRGTVSNPDGLGALLELSCEGVERSREIVTGGSFASTHSRVVQLPLAGCEDGGVLRIDWPSGLVEEVPVAGEVARIERTEPEFLVVEPEWLPADGGAVSTVTFTPLRPDGAPLGPGHDVAISATAGAVGAVADLGDGRYTVTVTAPVAPGSAALTVSVDGVALGAHPRVRFFEAGGDRTLVRASRGDYVAAGPPIVATVVPRDASGVLDGPGRTVTLDLVRGSLDGAVRDLGDGRYEAHVVGDGGGPLEARARVDGVPRGPVARVDEIAAVDPTTSFVRVVPGAAERDRVEDDEDPAKVAVVISPRDGNGVPVADARDHEYELRGRDGVVVPLSVSEQTASFGADLLASVLAEEGPLEIRVDGVLLDRRADLLVYDEPARVAEAVDPERSLIGSFHGSAYADGEDYFWIVARLQDSEGDALPWVDGFELEADFLELAEGRLHRMGTQFKARMRATGAAGEHFVSVVFEGDPIGVDLPVELVSPVEHDLDSIGMRTCLTDRWRPVGSGGAVRVRVQPHDEHGVLLGSSVPVGVFVDGVQIAREYILPGAFVASVRVPTMPGRALVQAEILGTGRGSTTFIEFLGPDDEPEDESRPACVELQEGYERIEPGEDAGPEAGPDSGGDAGQSDDAGDGGDAGGEPVDGAPQSMRARGGGCGCDSVGPGCGALSALAFVLLLRIVSMLTRIVRVLGGRPQRRG